LQVKAELFRFIITLQSCSATDKETTDKLFISTRNYIDHTEITMKWFMH